MRKVAFAPAASAKDATAVIIILFFSFSAFIQLTSARLGVGQGVNL
jgi:hypothetical protein